MVDQKYYTIQEAAKVLACDDETILAQIHSGELPAVNIARRLQSELGRWLLKRGNAAKQVIALNSAKRPTPNQFG